jgi:mRNA interferase MazF
MVPTAPRSATGLPVDSKAQAEQVRSIAIERLGRRIGTLDAELQTDLDEALRLHLAL